LALAERRIHREPCGHGIDDLLRTAWVYDYPLVSSIAARHLAEIYTTRKQFDWASEMLDWLVERGDPELTDWASNRRRALQTQARELGTDDLARSLAWRVQKTIRTRRPGAELHPMRTLIVGAGSGARRLLQDLNMKRVAVIGLIDDYVAGSVGDHKVLGRIDELPDLLRGRHVDQVLLAVPSASPDLAYNVGMVCAQAGVRLRVLPNPFELLADRRYGRQLRRLRVEETYGDGPVTVDPTAGDCVRARSVLIIGAGAIGSELARQVVVARPRHLALFDSSEAALESVTSELKEARRFKWTFAQLGDIANRNEIRDSMELHKPEIVFVVSGVNHAHLAEQNLVHAARVNVLGPWIAAQEAVRAGVERMILVSSDNAAQRHSSFDLTKAIAERVVCNLDCDSTCIAAVRLANVWRTPGTVVNRFERQIDYGGPVTLTGSGMTRRFLTRHAAAYWLLRVAAMAEPGAIYAVDAGVEVSIAELAERLIKLRGWEPGRDIKIADRGTRVGEKLSTQLWGADEPLQTTAIEQVVKVTSRPLEPALANEYLSRIEQRGDAEPEFVEKLLRAADTLCGQTQEGQRLLQAGQT
jgi:FlaA1/EpsC-like NDP-sugar epimerase